MDKKPFFVIAIFFIIGIILGRFLQNHISLIQAFWVAIFFIIGTIIFAIRSRRAGLNLPYGIGASKIAHIFLFLSIISAGSLLYLNSNIFPSNHISNFLGKDKVKADIIGTIKGPAEARGVYYGKVRSRYVFEIESMRLQGDKVTRTQGHKDTRTQETAWLKVNGLALIRIQTEKDYQYGDRLLVRGTIKNPKSKYYQIPNKSQIQNPKSQKTNFNYAEYLENQNIFAIINATDKNVTLLAHDYKVNPVLRFAYFIRENLKNQFLRKMPLESGAFMRAILLGDRSELPKKLNESFRNSGTMHILAISGLNVGLIAIALLYFFKFLRLRREIYYTLTMLFLLFLMLLTGSSPSVVRATIMCIIFLIGRLLGRPIDAYNTLGIAALFILAVNPKDIFNVGFQLSFIAVLSMVYLVPRLMRFVKKEINFYVRRYLLEPLAVSISASIGTFPFIMYYFRMVTPIAVISNIFIVPLMFILMIGGLCFIALGWIPFIGALIAGFNHMLASVIFFLAGFFAGIRFGHFNL